jgi:hypothetical protein
MSTRERADPPVSGVAQEDRKVAIQDSKFKIQDQIHQRIRH